MRYFHPFFSFSIKDINLPLYNQKEMRHDFGEMTTLWVRPNIEWDKVFHWQPLCWHQFVFFASYCSTPLLSRSNWWLTLSVFAFFWEKSKMKIQPEARLIIDIMGCQNYHWRIQQPKHIIWILPTIGKVRGFTGQPLKSILGKQKCFFRNNS